MRGTFFFFQDSIFFINRMNIFKEKRNLLTFQTSLGSLALFVDIRSAMPIIFVIVLPPN